VKHDQIQDVGRKLDQELERLREIAEKKISPATRVKAAKALRSVSGRLTRLAEEIEPKSAPKEQAQRRPTPGGCDPGCIDRNTLGRCHWDLGRKSHVHKLLSQLSNTRTLSKPGSRVPSTRCMLT
jgi:hypothetical protein